MTLEEKIRSAVMYGSIKPERGKRWPGKNRFLFEQRGEETQMRQNPALDSLTGIP